MNSGATLTSSDAVPASTRRSAALRATLYAPNQSTPHVITPGSPARPTIGGRRISIIAPSAALATSRRASARGPGPSSRPA